MDKLLTYKRLFIALALVAFVALPIAYIGSPSLGTFLTHNDPNFHVDEHWEELSKDLPQNYQRDLYRAHSLNEAIQIKKAILQELEDKRVLDAAGEQGHFARFIAALCDFPSLLVLFAAFWVRSFWKLLLIALIAAFLGEIAITLFKITHEDLGLTYRVPAQVLVACIAFWTVNSLKKHKAKA